MKRTPPQEPAVISSSPLPGDAELRQWFHEGASGNEESYSRFLKEIGGFVRRFLRGRLPVTSARGEEILEDLVQDVLIAIHTKRHTYRTDHPILPWVQAIARYRTIDYLRMMKARPQTIRFFADEDGAEMDRLDNAVSLERHEEENQRRLETEKHEELLELMEILTPQQRQVLTLAKLEELPLQEIAERLEMSLSSVKVTVHRAVQKLFKQQAGKKGDA